MSIFHNFYFSRYFIESPVVATKNDSYNRLFNLKSLSVNDIFFVISPVFSKLPRSFSINSSFDSPITFGYSYPFLRTAVPLAWFYQDKRYHLSWYFLLRRLQYTEASAVNSLPIALKLVLFFSMTSRLRFFIAYSFRMFTNKSTIYILYFLNLLWLHFHN